MSALASIALLLALAQQASTPAPEVRSVLDVPYRKVEGVELALDVYLPRSDGPHPAVVLVHGGAWMHGNRRDLREVGELLAKRGLACISVSYRLAPAARFPAQIEDCLYAVQFVRAHAAEYSLDREHIGALGFSAGGHLVDLLGVMDERRDPAAADPVLRESSRVQCVVSYFGPSLIEKAPSKGVDTQAPPELFGDAPDTLYARASPLTFVTKDDPPFLLIHGDADTSVPIEHSRWMDAKLREAGVTSELVVIAGGGHGDFFSKDPLGAYWKRTESFLSERLKPAAARR